MSYIVILNASADSVFCSLINEVTFEKEGGNFTLSRVELASQVKANSLKPINFSLDRRGDIKEDAGSFKRFHPNGVGIVVAEIQNSYGRTLGYKVIQNTTGVVVNLKTEDIVSKEEQLGRPFLQNGIVRNKTVNCYPLHKFPVIKLEKESKSKHVKMVPEKAKASKAPLDYTPAQINELTTCRSRGINSKFIENPKLSPEQMRVCWVAKSKGILSEYFAKPEYSVEVMKFYADRLVNRQIVNECAGLLSKPNLPLDELSELYLCICDGVDYISYIGKSASDIYVYRNSKSPFVNNATYDGDMSFDKAMNVAMKLKGWN